MTTEQKIIEFMIKNRQKHGPHCGAYVNDIMAKYNIPYSELKTPLNDLYLAQTIKLRDGAGGKLLFLDEEFYGKNIKTAKK